MIRRYTREEYVERVTALRDAVPGLSLSTDLIVGFPGETEAQFEETVSLVEELKFTGIFAFKYSPRPRTPSLKLKDDVSEEEKSRRLDLLFTRHDVLRRANLDALVGTTQEVLCEGRKKDGAYTGRTVRNEIVHFGSLADVTGQVCRVRIGVSFKNSLGAELLDETLRVPVTALPRVLSHADESAPIEDLRSPVPQVKAMIGESKRQLRVL
jgi:tRNA-2-methylthio-N6-dimethylallyladenosine synthase